MKRHDLPKTFIGTLYTEHVAIYVSRGGEQLAIFSPAGDLNAVCIEGMEPLTKHELALYEGYGV